MTVPLNRPVETKDYGIRSKEGKSKKVSQPVSVKKKRPKKKS